MKMTTADGTGIGRGLLLADVLLLVGSVGHLAQLVLLGKLARQYTEVLDEGLGGIDDGLAGGDNAIRLAAELEVGSQGVRDLKCRQSVCWHQQYDVSAHIPCKRRR